MTMTDKESIRIYCYGWGGVWSPLNLVAVHTEGSRNIRVGV